VSASLVPLLAGSNWGTAVGVEGFMGGPDVNNNSRLNQFAPGYFSTLGIPLIAGREFTPSDRLGTRKVAIVNETFAKKFGLDQNAVGALMKRNGSDGELDMEIVGLVQDAKYTEVKDIIPPLFFTPYRQEERVGSMSFYIRTAIEPEQFLRSVQAVVTNVDADLPVEDLRTMPQQVKENVFLDRFVSTMSAAFAALATLLAAVGLYGVLTFTVTERTREFGLRMALGADAANLRSVVLRQVALMAVIGGLAGFGMAWGIGGAAESLLFEMQGRDPMVLGAAFAIHGIVALGAGYLPALRASRSDPKKALRWE
jgi:predicted permease